MLILTNCLNRFDKEKLERSVNEVEVQRNKKEHEMEDLKRNVEQKLGNMNDLNRYNHSKCLYCKFLFFLKSSNKVR